MSPHICRITYYQALNKDAWCEHVMLLCLMGKKYKTHGKTTGSINGHSKEIQKSQLAGRWDGMRRQGPACCPRKLRTCILPQPRTSILPEPRTCILSEPRGSPTRSSLFSQCRISQLICIQVSTPYQHVADRRATETQVDLLQKLRLGRKRAETRPATARKADD